MSGLKQRKQGSRETSRTFSLIGYSAIRCYVAYPMSWWFSFDGIHLRPIRLKHSIRNHLKWRSLSIVCLYLVPKSLPFLSCGSPDRSVSDVLAADSQTRLLNFWSKMPLRCLRFKEPIAMKYIFLYTIQLQGTNGVMRVIFQLHPWVVFSGWRRGKQVASVSYGWLAHTQMQKKSTETRWTRYP